MNKLYNPSLKDINLFYKIINNTVYRVLDNYDIEVIYKMEPLEYVFNYRFYYINETYYLVVNYNINQFPFFRRVTINLKTGKMYDKDDSTIILHDIVRCVNDKVYIFIGEWFLDGKIQEFKVSINNDSNFEIIEII